MVEKLHLYLLLGSKKGGTFEKNKNPHGKSTFFGSRAG
jgi:hypothetical protein